MQIQPEEFHRETFAELLDVLGDELEGAVVAPFRASSRDLLDKSKAALERGDRAAVKAHAHSLKGASRTVGLIGMGDAAAAVEAGAAGEPPPALAAKLDALERAFARGLEILAAGLRGE